MRCFGDVRILSVHPFRASPDAAPVGRVKLPSILIESLPSSETDATSYIKSIRDIVKNLSTASFD